MARRLEIGRRVNRLSLPSLGCQFLSVPVPSIWVWTKTDLELPRGRNVNAGINIFYGMKMTDVT